MILVIYGSIRDIVPKNKLGIDEHECMNQSLLCVLSRMMSKDFDAHNIILNFINFFLSCCDMFERTTYNLENESLLPIWFTKGNFLSLLNLPSQIAKFGNVRLYWEGSRERSIQQIKPFLVNMRSTSSFLTTKISKFHECIYLKQLAIFVMMLI